MKKILPLMIVFIFAALSHLFAQAHDVVSPDNNIRLIVSTGEKITWSVRYKDKLVIDHSEIALTVNQNQVLGLNPKLTKATKNSKDEIITADVPQKFARIRDEYNELTLSFRGNYAVIFRVYNDGVAYRFNTSFRNDITVHAEVLQLNFTENTTSLFPEEESLVSHYERLYIPSRLDTIANTKFCSLPVLMTVDNAVRVVFTESDLYDYPAMFLYGTSGNGLKAGFPKHVLEARPMPGAEDRNEMITRTADFIARTSGTRSFPWRVCIITDDDRKLIESNLVYQLATPSKIEDTGWIKPGKVAWDWYNANNIYGVDFKSGINTETYKYYIDFASTYGLDYIILDEGWSRTSTNILESNPEIDVHELIRYGKTKNIGIILWMLWKPLDENLAEVLKTYNSWGVAGIKVDFMQRADQYMVNYYERVAAEAAKYKLLADFHGAFKPTGLGRTYPNVISYEGVKGNENNKWSADVTPEHNVTIPFTRMASGPMDFTPGAMSNAQANNYHISFNRPMSLGTRCHQAAMYIVFESPLQMLCDAPSAYYREKETVEFISRIPTVWDETIVLQAQLSDYVAIARRNGNNWYIGAMTDWTARDLEIDLSFLPEGIFKMESMKDGVNADRYAEDYKKDTTSVSRQSKVKITMAHGGGWAAIISK